MKKTAVIVLAGGMGKRMQSDMPKALNLLHGKPLISHVVESVKESGVCDKPIVVVGYRREEIKKALGDSCEYVTQEEQLGTGHAVLMTEPALRNNAETVIVVNCDTPFISAESIKKLESISETDNHVLRMATVAVPDFSDWKAGFFDFGRIIRDTEGKIQKIVEKKDATETELAITEVNSGLYAFRADWLYDHLHKLENNNIQKEYYLTDLIGMAIQENLTVGSIKIDPKEALGVNTKEHLELLHTL